jgi:predicted glycosyltransferase
MLEALSSRQLLATAESPASATLGGKPMKKDAGQGGPEEESLRKGCVAPKKIWIDLDNSPHVPFFLPIAEELRKKGHEVLLTAKDSYQVCDLLKFHNVACKVIGKHWGKNRFFKILGTVIRGVQLAFFIRKEKVDLAISHVSRSQLVCCFLLGTQTLTIADYEFIAKLGFQKSDWLFMPEFIEDSGAPPAKNAMMKYPGLKEDVYVPRFHPDPSIKDALELGSEDLVVTVRPPATEAHYHNPEGEVLLDATLRMLLERPDTRVILLPRNERQDKVLHKDWSKWIENRKIIIPDKVVDGLNLIWFSDLVISGGGTMNREAAALGVPVYSIFRGRIGSIDQYLARTGRLVLIENEEQLRSKVKLAKRQPASESSIQRSGALDCIVAGITSIVEHHRLPERV